MLVLSQMADITWNYHSNNEKGEASKYTQNNISFGFHGLNYKKQEFHIGYSGDCIVLYSGDKEMAVISDQSDLSRFLYNQYSQYAWDKTRHIVMTTTNYKFKL